MQDGARFGMDAQSLADLADAMTAADDTTDDEGIWPENVEVVEAFLAVSSQWRVVTIGGGMMPALPLYVGLDYAAARAALDAEKITVTPDLWRGLRIMESHACKALNETDQ